ncbi:MAG: glycosyl hydrolase family 28-related protein [Verrucomicrobiales bacterium]|nr:glycosyl hydrolase family 28-related protein [Verrucomicrobiales bacterium]
MIRLCYIAFPPLLSLTLLPAQEAPVPIVFPADGGIINVLDFGAVPDDGKDDTKAIQEALNFHPAGNRIIYLPPGTYRVTDTLKWPDGDHPGVAQKRTILQGAGEALSILEVPEKTKKFTEGQHSPVIWTGNKPAQRFRNAVRDLTIRIRKDNWNAIGMQFNASNQGGIRNVTIESENGSGKIGLDLGHTDEIGPLLVKNLTVDGFEVGISTKWPVNSATFETITLRDQRKFGWWNYHQMIFVRKLSSENRVTALYNERNSWGSIVLMDSHLHGIKAPHHIPGILNQRQMVFQNVEIFDYRKPVDHSDKNRDKGDVDEDGLITNDTSHRNVASLFRELKDNSLDGIEDLPSLPIKETPTVPWGDPGKDWANLNGFGADPTGEKDSSPALQRAIDSGAKTVYLPAGATFRFDSEVRIRGPVQRIIGLEGRFTTEGTPLWKFVDNNHPAGLKDSPAVIIERISGRSGAAPMLIRHESKRTLIVSSTMGFNVEGHNTGDLFLEDFSGHLDRVAPNQSAWCRQLNSERKGTKCRNTGGKLWILGMKTENVGTVIETTNGGLTEVNGLFLYSNTGWDKDVPAFLIMDSTAILRGINERNFNRSPVSFWVSETQGDETKELQERPWVYLSK